MYAHVEMQYTHARFVWPFPHSTPRQVGPYLTPILDTLLKHLNNSSVWFADSDHWSRTMGMSPRAPSSLSLSVSLSPSLPALSLPALSCLSFLSLACSCLSRVYPACVRLHKGSTVASLCVPSFAFGAVSVCHRSDPLAVVMSKYPKIVSPRTSGMLSAVVRKW